MQHRIITGEKAREHHCAAVRLVVHGDHECWTRYLVLDRAKVISEIRRYRELGYGYEQSLRNAICPLWSSGESGAGREFSRLPFRMKTGSRRWIVWVQSGGLDI